MATSGTAGAAAAPSPPVRDERVREVGLLRRLLSRPELGAVGGAIIAWIFFAVDAGGGVISWGATAPLIEGAAPLANISGAGGVLFVGAGVGLLGGAVVGGA